MKKHVKTPTVYQMESTECGAAALAMVFAYYGKYIPLEQMRIETGVSRDGCNAGNLMKAGRKFGFIVHGYRKEPQELTKFRPPCIIHWNFNHFVVWEGFHSGHVYINDPATGRRKLTMEEFDECFTGVVLTFIPSENFQKEKKKHTETAFLKNRLKGQGSSLLQLLLVGLLLVFPGILLPVLSQVFMDDILIGGNTGWFPALLLFMGGAVLMQVLLSVYRNFLLARLQKKMVLLSARDFLENMLRLPISFFDQRYAGDLTSRINNNASISDFLTGDLAQTLLNIFIALFYLVLLFLYSPILAGIALLSVVCNCLAVRITSGAISNRSVKLQQDTGKLAGAVYAGLSISGTIKASGAENEYASRILGYSARSDTLSQEFSRYQQMVSAVPGAIRMLTDLILLMVGGTLVIHGKMTVGMLVAFTTLFGSFQEPVEQMTEFVKKFQTTRADISRVEDIMYYPLDARYLENTRQIPMEGKLEGEVELRNVTFGYSALADPLIRDFSIRIPCGSSIAFVGASGSGKSTISKVISGLYQPWEGEVLFDGKRSSEIPNPVINASISTVSQNITLFSGTVRENLTMWNKNVSDADMMAAAKDACIHDVISEKPGGYDYRLSENASNLSGGQRQRMEIARALVTNPSVLIMDEATSALDPIVEKQIVDNIKRRGCTCVIVAHRLSAIRDCDQIIVMDHGQMVQRGTHTELAGQDGYYRKFIQNL